MRQGSYLLSGLLFLLGAAAVALTSTMTGNLGHSQATDSFHGLVLAAMFVLIDVAVVGMALASGWLVRHCRPVAAAIAIFATLVFGACSFGGVIGFGAGTRIAKARLAEDAHAAQQKLVENTNKVAISMAEKRAQWLHNTYVETRNKSERRSLLGESKAVVPTLQAPAVAAMADPQAQVLAELIGIKVLSAQLIITIAGALMLVLAKVLFFGFAPIMWPRIVPVATSAEPVVEVKAATPVITPPPKPPVAEMTTNIYRLRGDEQITPTAATHVDIDKDRAMQNIALWLQEETTEAPSNAIRSKLWYAHYRKWTERRKIRVSNMSLFKDTCQRLGVTYEMNSDETVNIKGRRFRSVQGAAARIAA